MSLTCRGIEIIRDSDICRSDTSTFGPSGLASLFSNLGVTMAPSHYIVPNVWCETEVDMVCERGLNLIVYRTLHYS